MFIRRDDVGTNQLFAWRKLFYQAMGCPTGRAAPTLLLVTVTAEPRKPAAATSIALDTIEIELGVASRHREVKLCKFS